MLNLRKIRLKKELSVPALSKLSNVPIRTIQDIEMRGDCRVSTLSRLAKALDVTLNDLYTLDEIAGE